MWCGKVCDLAQALRDGVLLCQLLNNLLPQAVNLKEINLRPQMSQVSPGPFLFHFHRSYPWRRLQQYATLRPRDRLIRKYCNLYLSLSGGLLRLCRKEDDVDEKMQKKNSNVTYRRNVQRKTNILLKKSSKKGFNRCTILIYNVCGEYLAMGEIR